MTADNAFQTTFSLPRRTESLIIQKQKLFIGFSLKKKLNICQITIEIWDSIKKQISWS